MNTTNPTSTAKKTPIKDSVEHALGDLEAITKEIELKIHLVSMEAKTVCPPCTAGAGSRVGVSSRRPAQQTSISHRAVVCGYRQVVALRGAPITTEPWAPLHI